MSTPGIVILVAAVVMLFWLFGTYNGLVRLRNHRKEAWSGIDTELKRRYDLIPNLVATVKGYASHERELLQKLTEARNKAVASTGEPATQASDEKQFVQSLRQVFAMVENYPDLKASEGFLKLQQELINTEDRIQAARRFFNANVRDLNNRVEMFPSSLIANMFSFTTSDYFEVEEAIIRDNPTVAL
jgi:LemA protein